MKGVAPGNMRPSPSTAEEQPCSPWKQRAQEPQSPEGIARQLPLWRKVMWAAVLYGGILLLVEVAGRIYLIWGGMPWNSPLSTYQNDDLLGYKPNPSFSLGDIRFNSMGFRADREYAAYPGPDTVRLLAVGGSTTFGTGGSAAEAYPARLEKALRRASRPCEVINAGVSGWQLLQIRHSLEGWIGLVHPDIVLFNEGWNTGSPPYKYYRNEHLITYPLFQYSLIFRWTDRRLRHIGKSLHYHPFLETREELRKQQERLNSDPAVFADYEEHLRACAELCQRAGIAAVFLIPPGNLPDAPALAPDDYFKGSAFEKKAPDYGAMCLAVNRTRDLSAERIFRVQKDYGFPVIDARRAFDGLGREERQALFYDELHLTPAGNQRLAEFVSQQLPTSLDSLYR